MFSLHSNCSLPALCLGRLWKKPNGIDCTSGLTFKEFKLQKRGDAFMDLLENTQHQNIESETPERRKRHRKGGRPCTDILQVRHKTIGVRVNQGEWEELRRKANAMHLTPSHWLRLTGLQKRLPPAPVPAINRLAYANLLRLSVNLNQLVKNVHMGKSDAPMPFLLELKQSVSTVQNQLMGLGDAVAIDIAKDNKTAPHDS